MSSTTTQQPPANDTGDAPAFGMKNFGNVVAVYVTMTDVAAHGLPFRATTAEQLVEAQSQLAAAAKFMDEQRALEYYKSSGKVDDDFAAIRAERDEARHRKGRKS